MRLRICSRCGESLSEKDGLLQCPYCGAKYDRADESQKLEDLLEEKKQEILANRRRVLWQEAHQPNPSAKALISAAKDVREIYEEDDLATFYLYLHGNDGTALGKYLESRIVPPSVAEEIVRLAVPSLNLRMVLPLKTFVERHFKGDAYFQYMSLIEKEAEKLQDGMYMTNLPRDVFLAYSSKDMPKVVEIADFLEKEKFTVFCALRNLRHGAGSAEFYSEGLKDAMKHCRAFVYLSSAHSRSIDCDALKEEIPFVLDHLPDVKRIHFRLDDDGEMGIAASILLKEFDSGREWCRSKEDLVARLLARDKKPEQGLEAKSSGPEFDAEGFLILRENNKDVIAESGRLIAYKGYEKKVKLSDDFHIVGKQAFKDAPELETLDFGHGVRQLEPLALNGARKLATIQGGSKLENIGNGAFAGTPALERIITPPTSAYIMLPNGFVIDKTGKRVIRYIGVIKRLEESAFRGIESIDPGAFAYNKELTYVALPGTIRSIGNGAFAGCPYLSTIRLSNDIGFVGKNVFARLGESTFITLDHKNIPSSWDPGFAGGTKLRNVP